MGCEILSKLRMKKNRYRFIRELGFLINLKSKTTGMKKSYSSIAFRLTKNY
jgi:hypothetical protein